jgi:glucose-6-phosphate 1-dehydrogenase
MGEEARIMKTNDQPEPTVFVIFCGAGALIWRKLVPALFDLSQDRRMPADFSALPVDRVDLSDEKLRRGMVEAKLTDLVDALASPGKNP